MESYVERSDNKSYQDELFDRLYKYDTDFIRKALNEQKEKFKEALGEMRKHTEECQRVMDNDFRMPCECGAYWENDLRKEVLTKIGGI
jgi:hypothetical protein